MLLFHLISLTVHTFTHVLVPILVLVLIILVPGKFLVIALVPVPVLASSPCLSLAPDLLLLSRLGIGSLSFRLPSHIVAPLMSVRYPHACSRGRMLRGIDGLRSTCCALWGRPSGAG